MRAVFALVTGAASWPRSHDNKCSSTVARVVQSRFRRRSGPPAVVPGAISDKATNPLRHVNPISTLTALTTYTMTVKGAGEQPPRSFTTR